VTNGLTEREKEILRLRRRGYADSRIARTMRLNRSDVFKCRKKARMKLAVAKSDLEFAKAHGVDV
jgi:DNA-binding CsgD family transcriptional regulator